MSESSGLPPEQEAVRRLLADARHDGPPPPDVARQMFFQGLDDMQAAHFNALLVPESPLRVY